MFVVVLAMATTASAQEDELDPYPHVQRYRQFVADLKSALQHSDPAAVALLTEFPLRVNAPGRVQFLIPDESSLQAHFEKVFPREARERVEAMRSEVPERVGEQFLLDHGLLWIEIVEHNAGPRFRLTTVNVPGSDTPIWPRLEMVCETPRHRIIIDQFSVEQSRYRAWNLPRALTEKPDLELKGLSTFEGTGACQHPVHIFERGDTRITASQGGCREDEWPANTIDVEIDGKQVNSWACL